MRELKRTLAAILAMAMIIGLFPHTAITARAEEGDGKSYETAIEISSGDTKTVSLSEEDSSRYFKFIPTETSCYSFTSISKTRVFCWLYDYENESYSAYSYNSTDFIIDRKFEKGQCYYFQVFFEDSSITDSFDVKLTETPADFTVCANNTESDTTDVIFDSEESTELTANVTTEGAAYYSYMWYIKDSDNKIVDLYYNSSTYTLNGSSVASNVYYCKVTNSSNVSHTVTFIIHPDNDLYAYTLDDENNKVSEASYEISPKGSIDLKAYAEAFDDNNITYSWYKVDQETNELSLIKDEKTSTLEVSASSNYEYYKCCVSDSYEYKSWVDYYISTTSNNLVAYPAGYPDNDSVDINVKPKASVKLEVVAEAENTNGITYTWYDGDTLLENNKASYSIAEIDGSHTYVCYVDDSFGSDTQNVYFNIYVDNDLSAYAWMDENDITYDYKEEYVEPKKSVTLKPIVSAIDT
ncbi:hypothetical protein SAMN06297422_106136 [Lachnospiraceae bacterium]|nr:hypothetical protein SAMN06297422_106136 [Lachnospiraceae bacterium]